MVRFNFEGKTYLAFDHNEPLNPHEKKYPCLVDAETGKIPVGEQRSMMLKMLDQLGVTYTRYKLKDTNTHDLVKVILTMGKFFNA